MRNTPSDSQIPENYRMEGADFLAALHDKQGIAPSEHANSATEYFGDANHSRGGMDAPNISVSTPNSIAPIAAPTGNPLLFPESQNPEPIQKEEQAANITDPNPNSPETPPTLTPNEQYLSEIEKKDAKKPPFFTNKILILFGGLIAVLLVAFVVGMVLNSAKEAPFKTALNVGSKLNNLQALIDYGEEQSEHIPRANTRKILREAAAVIPSRQHELSESFTLVADTKSGSSKKPTGDFVEKLDSELAAGNLDAAFADEFRETMDEARVAIVQLKNETKNKKGRVTCERAEKDLAELLERLGEE